jgi:hypothetical protein
VNAAEDSQAEASSSNRSITSGSKGMVLAALFWCILTAICDVGLLPGMIEQVRSYWFKPAPARIISSEVTEHPGSETPTYGVKVEFEYSVDGKEYSSDRYNFDNVKWADSDWARRAVRENPAGAERVCYYDPWNPSRAILERGLEGRELFMLMFMAPFNMAGAFLLWAAFWGRRYDQAELKPRFVDTLQNREGWSMARFNSSGLFFAMFGLTTFLGLFVTMIPSGFPPSRLKAESIWAIEIVISIVITIVFRRREVAGKYDLILDFSARQLSMPAMHKRKEVERIPFADVRAIRSRTFTEGSGEDKRETHQIHLQTRDGRELLLKEEISGLRATRLAKALAKRIGV